MPETIKIPGVGPVPRRYAIGGGVVLALILAVAWYRHSKAKGAAAPAARSGTAAFDAGFTGNPYGASDPYPPDGTVGDPTDPNSTDPASGNTYGDEQAGFGSTAFGGGPFFPSGGGSGGTTGGPPFATNAQWMQAAESYLSGIGSHPLTVAAALGKYLAGAPVDEAQQQVINEATGAEGDPPVAGRAGYPPLIHVTATHHHGGGDGGPTKTITANGKQTLGQIAAANHDTEAQLALWNKPLDKYIGTHKAIPRGTKVRV